MERDPIVVGGITLAPESEHFFRLPDGSPITFPWAPTALYAQEEWLIGERSDPLRDYKQLSAHHRISGKGAWFASVKAGVELQVDPDRKGLMVDKRFHVRFEEPIRTITQTIDGFYVAHQYQGKIKIENLYVDRNPSFISLVDTTGTLRWTHTRVTGVFVVEGRGRYWNTMLKNGVRLTFDTDQRGFAIDGLFHARLGGSIYQVLQVDDNFCVVLFDTSRNVYLLSRTGQVIWQISPPPEVKNPEKWRIFPMCLRGENDLVHLGDHSPNYLIDKATGKATVVAHDDLRDYYIYN